MTSKECINKMIEKYSWLGKEYCRLIENENPYKFNQQVFEEMANKVLQDLERLEELEKIFSDSHICEIKTRFNEIECSADKCDNCPLGLGDGICLKNTFEKKWKLQQENQELAKTLELYNEKFAGHERVKADLIKENQELKKEYKYLEECLKRRDEELRKEWAILTERERHFTEIIKEYNNRESSTIKPIRLEVSSANLLKQNIELTKALDKACERLDYDCPVSQDLISDLDCENCNNNTKGCWRKYFLGEVLEND